MRTACTLLVICVLASPAFGQSASDRAGSITGRVLRPDGIPQPDAEVVAATRGRDGKLRLLSYRSRTAFDGRYEITALPAGRYLVLVRLVGGDAPVEGRPLATLFPGVATTEPGTTVEVFEGIPVEGVDVWLLPAPRRFGVAGRVVDLQGRELENVAIEFGRPSSRASDVWTMTEPGGLFTLEGVPPGPIVLRARADSPDGPLVGVVATELAIESVQDVRIVVREPGRVRGQFVVDPGAGGVPNTLRVALVPTLLRPSALFPEEEVSPGAAGEFEVRGSVGQHELSVRGLPEGWSIKRVLRDGISVPSDQLWLNAAADLENIRVEIGPAAVRGRGAR